MRGASEGLYCAALSPIQFQIRCMGVQAMRGAGEGLYCAPLRLLAMEVADTCNAGGTFCSLITGAPLNCRRHAPAPAAIQLTKFRCCSNRIHSPRTAAGDSSPLLSRLCSASKHTCIPLCCRAGAAGGAGGGTPGVHHRDGRPGPPRGRGRHRRDSGPHWPPAGSTHGALRVAPHAVHPHGSGGHTIQTLTDPGP